MIIMFMILAFSIIVLHQFPVPEALYHSSPVISSSPFLAS